jgi:type II secretory ATPase GspE/PulE/Tfp pilus assembly ATPase PilB-like protein
MELDIAELLARENYVTQDTLTAARKYAVAHNTSPLEYLKTENIVSSEIIGQAVAEHFGVTYFDLSNQLINKEYTQLLSEETARQYRVIVVDFSINRVTITTDEPGQPKLTEILSKLLAGKSVQLCYSNTDDINEHLNLYRKPLDTRFSKIIAGNERVAPELLEEIFEDSLSYKASDIHFEPQIKEIVIRFRVDGVLHEAGRIPKQYYENILNRVKVQSGLRIDEHFSTQDGSLRYDSAGQVVDMRTSIVPTVEGEKVVLRVLSTYVQGLTLADLGLSAANQKTLQTIAAKPFGMILAAGPTGSGKTTTLYALLKLLNSPDTNITTIEDPVEYRMQGVNQIQVNPQTDFTFTKGLRAIVRQDPDIILVGEIRDQDTAEIAVNAALTGHLLLSTFHANDAATAIPRLIDMGIEPFLLASTLEVIVAQRLVRKLCTKCRHSVTKNQADFQTLQLQTAASYFHDATITLYAGNGCEICGFTGYKGRTAIFELIRITPAMQELIAQKPSKQTIWELASREGAQSFFEDGITKVKNGITSIEELSRVAEPPKNPQRLTSAAPAHETASLRAATAIRARQHRSAEPIRAPAVARDNPTISPHAQDPK